jgi:adenylate kinase family enzyme
MLVFLKKVIKKILKKLKALLLYFSKITTYALVGGSGTGKSFRAKLLAQKYGIDVIIDDGLLIQQDRIIAGHSAKREKTYMGAVRTALFDDKQYRDQVAKMLQKIKPKKVLILGTSEKMVQKIAMRIQVPPPAKVIMIEEIATKEEIEQAMRSREIEGKHVIPVPAIEIKRKYPRIFYDAVRVFRKKTGLGTASAFKLYEKSVVQPEFSKKGGISISEEALAQMVRYCVYEFDSQVTIKKLAIKSSAQGYRIIITIDVPFGMQLTGKIHNLQEHVVNNVERDTGILIEEVSFIIDKITQIDGRAVRKR